MKRLARSLLILAALAAVFLAGYGYGRWYGPRGDGGAASTGKGGRKVLYYVDPMHPWYKSDKPGTAPDCGMKLEPVYADSGPAAQPQAERKVLHYRDPQDPKYTAEQPGINPETGNDLEPVYADDPAAMPPGTVQISLERQQLIGVRYGTAELTSASQTIRAEGRVAPDETRISRVHTKVEGWIERSLVNFTGELVKRGQPLLTLYSPELLATQQEYLLALKARDIMSGSSLREAATNSDSLVEAARRRLELWDLSRAQIEEIRRTGQPIKSVTIHSPASGYVTARNAFPNQRVMPETELYTITDLSRVWIMADVFEADIGAVRLGQAAEVSVPTETGRSFTARVAYLQPQVDPATRTLKVRLEAANPALRLKPDMFVDVLFPVASAQRLTVPAGAVLDTGTASTVFVDRGNGFLEPRTVETGQRTSDRVEILQGLKPGERIVTSGTFLLNSESQLKSAMSNMAGMPGMSAGRAEPSQPPRQEQSPAQMGPPKRGQTGMSDMPGMEEKKP